MQKLSFCINGPLCPLHNYEGHIIAPYARMNTKQDFQREDNDVSAVPYINWLYWGWGPNTQSVKFEDFIDCLETSFTIYNALLPDVVPGQVFDNIASGKYAPFEFKTSASTFGHYSTGSPHMMLNSFYRTGLYAIGTANFRWVPDDGVDSDHNSFNIVWHSADRFNYIECSHPFWYSDGDANGRTPDSWLHGNNSPFQQIAHYKNTAIVLYDIPEKDPWPGKPSPKERWAWRDAHANSLIKRGMFRYPKSMDEKTEKDGWIFLREGEVYIGVKPLNDYYIQTDLKGGGMEGFNVVKSDFSKCGFIFEVGTEKEFGNFDKFRSQLLKNKVSVDWGKMTVNYTSSQNNNLQIQYQPGLPVAKVDRLPVPEHLEQLGITGMAESVPVVTINGQQQIPW